MNIELREELLNSKESHIRDVGGFSCGAETESLEEYIKSKAFEETRNNKEKVYLVKNDSEIVGYYSLKASAINYIFNGINDVRPILELSEFAIDIKYQRQKYGTFIMLNLVFDKIIRISNIIGCQGIITFALGKNAIRFYESIGFEKIDLTDKDVLIDNFSMNCTPMVISIDTINSLKK